MTPPLPAFTVLQPTSRDEAAAWLAGGARALAGGTDLIPNLRRGLEQPARLVDLSRVAGLDGIELTPTMLRLGAGVTLTRLAGHEAVRTHLGALAEAAGQVAGPGHRSAATLGGNLCQDTRCVFYNQSAWWREANGWCLKRAGDTCHVAPQGQRCHAACCSDLAPVLLAVDAQLEIATPQGTRTMPLAQLYRDDGAAHLRLAAGEFVCTVHVPLRAGRRCAYRKARVRGAMDFPLAGVGVAAVFEGAVIVEIGVGLSGTNSGALKLDGTDALVGHPVDDERLARLGKLVQQQASPMRSTVTQANYRRQVAAVLAQRLLRELAEAA
jgi:4-hydroxybenzoyl-CoA reductase subunit beta